MEESVFASCESEGQVVIFTYNWNIHFPKKDLRDRRSSAPSAFWQQVQEYWHFSAKFIPRSRTPLGTQVFLNLGALHFFESGCSLDWNSVLGLPEDKNMRSYFESKEELLWKIYVICWTLTEIQRSQCLRNTTEFSINFQRKEKI